MIYIEGKKVYLKSFTRKEYHELYMSYIADPVMDPHPYMYDEIQVNQKYNTITEKESWYPRVGIFLYNHTPIGELSFKRIDHEKSQCELGIVLANDNYKGKGYGQEAIQLAIDYAFKTLKLKQILADTMGSNYKMQWILEKFGFKFIKKDKNFYRMNDRLEDKLYYKLSN